MKNEGLDYEQILEDYNNDKAFFSIELAKARVFLMKNTIYASKFYLWTSFNYLVFPIIILILSIVELGFLGGIIYSVIAFIFFFDISASASINFKNARISFGVFAIIGILLKFIFGINLNFSFWITLIQYASIYYFYMSIGKTIINKFLLVDKNTFFSLYDDIFYIKYVD